MNIIAYATDKVTLSNALTDPFWRDRIEPAGPWFYFPADVKGKKCIVVAQKKSETPPTLKDFKDPIEIEENLYYFPCKKLPDIEEVAKENIAHETKDYTTSMGVTLSIPLYRSIPRVLNSRSIVGKAVGVFAKRCESLFQKLSEGKQAEDKELILFVYAAIQECYSVTDDLLDDLQWVTTKDIDPILERVLGLDPKSLPNEKES